MNGNIYRCTSTLHIYNFKTQHLTKGKTDFTLASYCLSFTSMTPVTLIESSLQQKAFLHPYSHFDVIYGGRKVKVVTQDVKCGDKITPLD